MAAGGASAMYGTERGDRQSSEAVDVNTRPDSGRTVAGSFIRRVAAAPFHTFMFAIFPLVSVVAANAPSYPIDGFIVGRAILVLILGTALLLWLLRAFGWTLAARAAFLSVFLLAADSYSLVPVPVTFQRPPDGANGVFAILYLLACALVAGVAIRPWRVKSRDPIPLTIVAMVLLAMNVTPLARATLSGGEPWRVAANRLTSPPEPIPGKTPPGRDVYVIILDAFGRPDVIRNSYGVDMNPFVSWLQARGFYVPNRSHSNYAQTFLAISSMLNMQYLDEIAIATGRNSQDRRPLKHAIESNAMMKLASRAGRTVVAIGSDYTATDAFPSADVCYCPRPSPHELEASVLRLSPFRDLGSEAWIATGRRRHVEYSFDAIERASGLAGQKLVVAHILTPHPPFVFDRYGRPRQPPPGMPFIAGEWLSRSIRSVPSFRGEYVRGYAEQVEFVVSRVTRILQRLLSLPGPQPAIMIVGDHGPALDLDLVDPDRTNMHERMSSFAAYYLPGDEDPGLYPELSPINGLRAIAGRYFGVRAPFLPERSWFSTWPHPYVFIRVDADGRSDEGAPQAVLPLPR
jgi:hypothetical protein